MKIGIVGSRDIKDAEEVYKIICEKVPSNCTEIVSGGAYGVDSLAERYAKENGIVMKVFYPEYEKYGKMATLIRNTEIVRHSDKVLAFFCNEDSKGTADTVKKCLELGVVVEAYTI